MELSLSVDYLKNKMAVITASGKLTAFTSGQLKQIIKQLVEEDKSYVVLNLTQVDFIDSSGLSAMVTGLKATKEKGGWLRLVGLNENISKVFELTRLNRIFDIYKNTEDSLL